MSFLAPEIVSSEIGAVAAPAVLDIDAVRAMADRYGIPHDKATFAVIKRAPDGGKVARKSLVGLTPENIEQLRRWHDVDGFGVSMMLQSMDGNGRKAENVLAWNVVSLDSARGQAIPQVWPGNLPPSEVVQSRVGSWHAHWILVEGIEPQRGVFIAKAIARQLEGDVGAVSITQPWRVTGSHHFEVPRDRCRSLTWNGGSVAAEALEAAYAAHLDKPVSPKPIVAVAASPQSALAKLDYLLGHCSLVTPARPIWIAIGQAIHAAVDAGEAGFQRWHEISRQSPGYPGEKACRAEWRTFGKGRSRHATFATITHHARECGLDLSAFGKAFPSNDKPKRQLKLVPMLAAGGWAYVDNARFGAQRHLALPLTARHELLFLHALQPHRGDVIHTKAASEAMAGTRANTAIGAIDKLAAAGLLSVIQEPTNKAPGRYRLSATQWCREKRGAGVKSARGSIVDARPLNGSTMLPNTIWASPSWRLAGEAGREIALLALAIAGNCRSDRVFELSWNIVEAHTGIRFGVGKTLKLLCDLGILECVREGSSMGAVGLYKVGPWLHKMDELNASV